MNASGLLRVEFRNYPLEQGRQGPGRNCFALVVVVGCLLALPAAAQRTSLVRGPHRLEIVLERWNASGWEKIDPGLVLKHDDRVRFRATANFDGYLYVMNQGTSGDYAQLFPSKDAGQQNEIHAGKEYLVPATEGVFRITGPAGHEIVYWMITPAELGARPEYAPLPPPPDPQSLPPHLLPRCDDTIFRARGDCVDTSAGPRAVNDGSQLPQNLAQVPKTNGGELLFVQKEGSSVVSAPPALEGPVIFEFRLAHN
jgi:Domain of unknown function (DUF4384)